MALVGNISGSSAYSSNIGISGSVVIANRPDALFPTLGSVGGDVVFFVSGSRGGKNSTTERTVSVFGGDAVVSGSLTIGTGSVTITSNDVQFNAFDTRIESGSGGLTFFDAGNTGGITLSSLAASSGDVVGPASATDNAITRFDLTTGKLLQNSDITISDTSGGSVTVNTVASTTLNLFSSTATTVNFAGSASTLAIGTAGGATTMNGNVTVSGDLTVNGTTTTVSTQNLLVEDPVIYFGSGSVGVNRDGGIALASGSSVVNQALVWGRVANDTWGAGRLDVSNGTETNLTGMSLLPVRASKFEVGGTSAYVTSSDGLNLFINHASATTFGKAGTPTVNITDYLGSSGEGMILGITTGGARNPLWISGSAVTVGAATLDIVGLNDIRSARLTPVVPGGGIRFEAQDGTTASRPMVLSGSQVTIGGNNRFIVLEGAERAFLTASSDSGFTTVSLTPGAGFTTANLFNSISTSVNIANGATTGTSIGNATGGVTLNGNATVTGDLAVNGATSADITTTTSTATLFNTTATTVNLAGAATTLNVANAATVNQTLNIATGATTTGNTKAINLGTAGDVGSTTNVSVGSSNGGTTSINGNLTIGTTGTQRVTFNALVQSDIQPDGDRTRDLGGPNARWRNIYTGDLHLKNERGDYTLIEEEDFLSIRFNKTGKRYKFVLEPVPELDEK